jgi:hypothetical protein
MWRTHHLPSRQYMHVRISQRSMTCIIPPAAQLNAHQLARACVSFLESCFSRHGDMGSVLQSCERVGVRTVVCGVSGSLISPRSESAAGSPGRRSLPRTAHEVYPGSLCATLQRRPYAAIATRAAYIAAPIHTVLRSRPGKCRSLGSSTTLHGRGFPG